MLVLKRAALVSGRGDGGGSAPVLCAGRLVHGGDHHPLGQPPRAPPRPPPPAGPGASSGASRC
eukprot:1148225-Rhodomonas_salina.2